MRKLIFCIAAGNFIALAGGIAIGRATVDRNPPVVSESTASVADFVFCTESGEVESFPVPADDDEEGRAIARAVAIANERRESVVATQSGKLVFIVNPQSK